jgi:hypothetical protein
MVVMVMAETRRVAGLMELEYVCRTAIEGCRRYGHNLKKQVMPAENILTSFSADCLPSNSNKEKGLS